MPITVTPGKGIEVTLDEYSSQQVNLGGADFWSFSNQQLLTKKLAPFLPRMEYNSATNKVCATMIQNGRELLGTSRPIPSNPPAIPAACLTKLQAAIDSLKAEAEEKETDANVRELILAFSLPNPRETPELYRLVGSELNPRLIVLWGMEKHGCTNVPLPNMEVARYFKTMAPPLLTPRNIMIAAGALLLLILALIIKGCCGGSSDEAKAPEEATAQPAPPIQQHTGQQPPVQQHTDQQTSVQQTSVQPDPAQLEPVKYDEVKDTAPFIYETEDLGNGKYALIIKVKTSGEEEIAGGTLCFPKNNISQSFKGAIWKKENLQKGNYIITIGIDFKYKSEPNKTWHKTHDTPYLITIPR